MLDNELYKYYKKSFFLFTGNEAKIQDINNKLFKNNGGRYGDNFKCYSNINGAESYLIKIGDNVTISTNVSLITHDNSVIKLGINATDTFGKIQIGDNCFIGARSIVLPGVTLGKNVVVGAGSVVTKSFKEGNVVIGGNPAKIICDIETFKYKNKDYYHNMDEIGREKKKDYLMNLEEENFLQK